MAGRQPRVGSLHEVVKAKDNNGSNSEHIKLSKQNPKESTSTQVREKERILRKTKQTNLCSLTGVNPLRTHGFGVWGGKRVVVGVRVDERLYEAFKPVAKLVFGSVCRPVEAFMAAVVASNQTQQLTSKLGVNPSNTVEIGKLVIERNVRSRRRLVVEETKEVREVVQKEKRVVQKPKRKPIDYSKLSLEELQSLFDKTRKLNRMGQMQTIAFEMKKRGISQRSY